MNKVQLILLLSIVIVILLLVDAFRRSKRKKYKKHMAELEKTQKADKANKKGQTYQAIQTQEKVLDVEVNKIELGEDIKVDPTSSQSVASFEEQKSYPALDEGYVLIYLSAPRGYVFNGQDILELFSQEGLYFNAAENSFQSVTEDGDVLYSIVADEKEPLFSGDTFSQSEYTLLVCILNAKKLAKFYDAAICFEHFFTSVSGLNTRLGATMLNEHKRRFTSSDDATYRSKMNSLKPEVVMD